MNEVERIKQVYKKRDCQDKRKLYTLFNISALYMYQQQEKSILKLLKRTGFSKLEDKLILDVGCGSGGVLREFIKYGARPKNLHGIDLLPDRIEEAERLSPNIEFTCGNAENLPYEDNFFDMILCFTVFSSILDRRMRQNIVREMLRVLKPEGIVLWYDYHVNNPRNPDVRGVKKREIHELFSGCEIHLRRITLAPPIVRALAPYSIILCQVLEKIPLLCTHYLGVIRKRG